MKELIDMEDGIKTYKGKQIPKEVLARAKANGFSDIYLAKLLGTDEDAIYKLRKSLNINPVFKLVDTCGAEFEAFTPYYYSTYESEDESRVE